MACQTAGRAEEVRLPGCEAGQKGWRPLGREDNLEEKNPYRPLLAGLTDREGAQLCADLRRQLVEDVAETGGHLASNLGAVELTVAIHRVFDTRQDRLVFDVGHQSYPHKMLTGRREQMSTIRQLGGIAGFPKPSESVHDAFIA